MAEVPESPPKQEKHLQYTWRGLKMVSEEKSIFELDEPIWHADEKSPVCDKCSTPFTFTHRKHHCRRCGEVVCTDCSEKCLLTRMAYVDPVIVCKECAPICKSEEEFFQHHLKILLAGAYFYLSDSAEAGLEYFCHLGPNHKQILISEGHLAIDLRLILEVKTITGEGEGSGARERSGSGGKSGSAKGMKLELVYRSGGLEQKLTLSPSHSHRRKQATDWLKALKKALVLLHSTK